MRYILPSLLLFAPALYAQEALPAEIEQAFCHYISMADELTPLLEGVKDKASANKAAEPLLVLMPRLYEVCVEVSKIPSLSPQQQEIVKQKHEKAMREKWGKVYQEMFRLQAAQCYCSARFTKAYQMMCMLLDK